MWNEYPLSMQLEAFDAGESYVTALCGWFVEFVTLERAIISNVHKELERCEQATFASNARGVMRYYILWQPLERV